MSQTSAKLPPRPTEDEVRGLLHFLAAVADSAKADAVDAVTAGDAAAAKCHAARYETVKGYLGTARAMKARMR